MKGLGTIINVSLIIAGGITGMLVGNRIKPNVRVSLSNVCGISAMTIGASGALSRILIIENGALTTQGTMMMVLCLVFGTLIGEILHLEARINGFGDWLKAKSASTGDSEFTDGFVQTTCTVCIGAMSIMGAITDGISGDYTILAAKGILDFIIVAVMTASKGKGCMFSAIPVAIVQGSFTILAIFLGSFMSEAAVADLSLVGSLLILCVGLNLIRDKKIAVANMLPSVFLAALWGTFFG